MLNSYMTNPKENGEFHKPKMKRVHAQRRKRRGQQDRRREQSRIMGMMPTGWGQ